MHVFFSSCFYFIDKENPQQSSTKSSGLPFKIHHLAIFKFVQIQTCLQFIQRNKDSFNNAMLEWNSATQEQYHRLHTLKCEMERKRAIAGVGSGLGKIPGVALVSEQFLDGIAFPPSSVESSPNSDNQDPLVFSQSDASPSSLSAYEYAVSQDKKFIEKFRNSSFDQLARLMNNTELFKELAAYHAPFLLSIRLVIIALSFFNYLHSFLCTEKSLMAINQCVMKKPVRFRTMFLRCLLLDSLLRDPKLRQEVTRRDTEITGCCFSDLHTKSFSTQFCPMSLEKKLGDLKIDLQRVFEHLFLAQLLNSSLKAQTVTKSLRLVPCCCQKLNVCHVSYQCFHIFADLILYYRCF